MSSHGDTKDFHFQQAFEAINQMQIQNVQLKLELKQKNDEIKRLQMIVASYDGLNAPPPPQANTILVEELPIDQKEEEMDSVNSSICKNKQNGQTIQNAEISKLNDAKSRTQGSDSESSSSSSERSSKLARFAQFRARRKKQSRPNCPNNVQRHPLSDPGSSSDSDSNSEFDPLPKTKRGSVDHRFGLCLYTGISRQFLEIDLLCSVITIWKTVNGTVHEIPLCGM